MRVDHLPEIANNVSRRKAKTLYRKKEVFDFSSAKEGLPDFRRLFNMNAYDLIRDIELVSEQVFGDKDALLVGVKPLMEYADGKSTGREIGTRVEVVLPSRKYAAITVKIPTVGDTKLLELVDRGGGMPVRFTNFVAKIYMHPNGKELGLSCTADSVTVVNAKEG